MPSPRLFYPESPNHETLLDRFGLPRAVLIPSQDRRSVTLAVDLEKSKSEYMFGTVTFQCSGDFEIGTLDFSLGLNGSNITSFFTLLSRLTEYTHMQRVVGSRTWRSALLHFLLSLEPYGSFSKVSISLRRQTDSVVDEGKALWAYNATAASAGAQSASFGLLEHISSQALVCRVSSGFVEYSCPYCSPLPLL